LAIGLSDGNVVLRDLATGDVIVHLPRHGCAVTALAFAPDRARLVSGYSDGTMHVWEANANCQWALARTINAGPVVVGLIPSAAFPFFIPHLHSPPISFIAVTPDGKQLGACFESMYLGTTIALWNLADGTPAGSFSRGQEKYQQLAFSPDGKFMAAGYWRSNGN